MLAPFGKFHRYQLKSLTAQTNGQKDRFHPYVQENMSVLHSSRAYPKLEKSPTFQNRFPLELTQ